MKIDEKNYCIRVFNSNLPNYGGFNHWIAKLFLWRLTYLDLYLKKQCKFYIYHNRKEDYHDGYHNSIWFGFILFSYGT